MADTVLVAYGTTNGSTAEIAEVVAETLREGGLTAQALPARSVTSVASYDAVVVGGGLYAGRWHKDARRFVRRHRVELAHRPVWLFSSGPLDSSAADRDVPPVRGVQRTMNRMDVQGHITFGGCLKEGARGRIANMIISSGKGGDFRDFGAIEEWAKDIAASLARV
ncbi:flavodoxin domain-containing protein [Streptomyces sp. NPDC059371]|uniref:flavodoxin domain-containing protein n=1 Tax=Streptomyces sp. NPDC059371 TaxID=3346812 RepID=UPI0036813477